MTNQLTLRFNCGHIEKRGQYLIDKGDKYLKQAKVVEATKYYAEATKYCAGKARQRLNEIPRQVQSPINSTPPDQPSVVNNSLSKETLVPSTMITGVVSQTPNLKGPYFPVLGAPQSQSSLASQSQETINCTIDKAPSTLFLATSFIKIKENTDEKLAIRDLIRKVILQFDKKTISLESMQELAVLATIPDKETFQIIIDQVLRVENSSPTLPVLVFQGLAVILNSCPEEIDLNDMHGIFLDILKPLKGRLTDIRTEHNSRQLLPLLQALSALFDVMLCRKVLRLDREVIYNPLNELLGRLVSHDDATVSFLAQYTKQALAYIGNDESLAMSVFRRGRLAIAIALNIQKIITDQDLCRFEEVYNNFMSMCDYSVKSIWYQGLIYADCLLGRQDWDRFERLVVESRLSSDERFMHGICLRLEQIAATQANDTVRSGAVRFLQDIQTGFKGNVQQSAQSALSRLGSSNRPGASGQSTSRLISYSQIQSSQYGWIPVWDPFWYSTPKNTLLKLAQDTTNMRKMPAQIDEITKTVQIIQNNVNRNSPKPCDMDQINKALQTYYKPYLTIQRISGQPVSLESCYVNLAIVVATDQRKMDKENLKKQAAAFQRITSYEKVQGVNMQAIIPIEELFNKRKLRDEKEGVPRRILIYGRAGIGKTTLCKKLVHAFQGGLWRDRFDAVLWVPLRQLKLFKSRNLKDLLLDNYFAHHPDEQEKEAFASEFITHPREEKILFILDGYDEVATDTQAQDDATLQGFLVRLLSKSNVIITSRPYAVDYSMLQNLDLELETVGFSSKNVGDYISSVLQPDEAKSVNQFIRQTPFIQGLVNIPVQLDLICYSWDSLPTNEQSVTMTGLYQTIVRKLWRKDAERLQKASGQKILSALQISKLPPRQIDGLMKTEIEYLGYLAFKGLQDGHQIEFDGSALYDTLEELNLSRSNTDKLSLQFVDELKKTSFLHTAEADEDPDKDGHLQAWHFLHLTFQEYFAAAWLAGNLQSPNMSTTPAEETETFIKQHKYNPRFDIIWWMLAGLLEGKALERFFDLLQEEPRDLIGCRHQLLISGCLKESRGQLDFSVVTRIEDELMEWLQLDMALSKGRKDGYLIRNNMIPESVLMKCMSLGKLNIKDVLDALRRRPYLTKTSIDILATILIENGDCKMATIDVLDAQANLQEPAITALIKALEDEDSNVRISSASVLRSQSSLPDSAITTLINALKEEGSNFRGLATLILGGQTGLPESAITSLINALKDEDSSVRYSAAEALRQPSFLELAITALINALKDDDSYVKRSAASALGSRSDLPESTITALIRALKDEDKDVRNPVVTALRNQSSLPESAIAALVNVLKDEDSSIKVSAVSALRSQSSLPEFAITALVGALKDEDKDVRNLSDSVLVSQSSLPASAIHSLIKALKDEDEDVRNSATSILVIQPSFPESAVTALIDALKDEDKDFRDSAVSILVTQSSLPESDITALIEALKDENKDVRNSAASVLENQSSFPEFAITALINALKDGDSCVRDSVASALSQSSLLEFAITTLVNVLKDEDSNVRYSAATVLRSQSSLPESAITALVNTLKDEDSDVRYSAASALGSQSNLPESAIIALINAFKDKDTSVRGSVTSALKRPSLLELAITALINALKDEDSYARRSAASILESQSSLPESAVIALTDALKDEDCGVRRSAASALGSQFSLPESAITTLVKALKDEDKRVMYSAASTLGGQSNLPESTITALVNALMDEDKDVMYSAASALRSQSNLTESAITALTNALKDEDRDVRRSAALALGSQSNLPESAITVLINALKDKDSDVRRSTASALGGQFSLPESAITALVNALKDEDSGVRDSVTSALRQPSLLEFAVAALINALKDKDSSVRYSAASVLGSQSSLPESAIATLIDAFKDEVEYVRDFTASVLRSQSDLTGSLIKILLNTLETESSQTRVLEGTPRICKEMADTSVSRIEGCYEYLYINSCRHPLSLYFQDNKLCYYMEQGFGELILASPDVREKITTAFYNLQAKYRNLRQLDLEKEVVTFESLRSERSPGKV